MSKGPEAKFQDKVMRDLRKIEGVWAYKTHDLVNVGIPDVLVCVRGKLVALELKAGRNKVTKLQQHVLEKIRKAGGKSQVVYPEQWPETKQAILEMSRSLI